MTESEQALAAAFAQIDDVFGDGRPPHGHAEPHEAAAAAYVEISGDAEFSDDDDFADEDVTNAEDDQDEGAKARLAAALAEIDARFGRPPAEQVSAFADAHQTLQATLNRIDTP